MVIGRAVTAARTLGAHVGENISIAFDVLRASLLRSGLTILGVVIGVATVMAMAAIVQGVRDQIVRTIELAGPTTFYVVRYYSQTPVNPDNLPREIRIRPELVPGDADRIARLPEIRYAAIWGGSRARLEYAGEHTQPMQILGANSGYTLINGGELTTGRWFTRSEELSGAAVAVVGTDAATRIFGHVQPLEKMIRIGGRPARVIGVYQQAANIFTPPGGGIGAIIPYLMLDHQFHLDHQNAVYIAVKPRPGVTVTDAQTDVMLALRETRHLHPGELNTFDLISQDQILETFNKVTGAFFWIMIALASVGLLVGGIGVMAMMMVSVTARTREIGIRKALGATRADILTQFLIESAVLTAIGGVIGLIIGLSAGRVLSLVLRLNAVPPTSLTTVAIVVSVGAGIVFGLLPAIRAARLDPVDALRYE